MASNEWLVALLIAGSLGHTGTPPRAIPLAARSPYVQQALPVRVGIAQYAQAVKVVPGARAAAALECDDGTKSLTLAKGQALLARPFDCAQGRPQADRIVVEAGGAQIACRRVTVTTPGTTRVFSWGVRSREGTYRGDIEVVYDSNGTLSAVNALALEHYLEGVVAQEVPLTFHPEALKAQAIIARTYALFTLGKHARQGFDLCDGMHCQQYRGAVSDRRALEAVRGTAGQVLAYRGYLAETVYHTTCGGFVDDAYRVWRGYLAPYLRARPDMPGRGDPMGWIEDDDQAAEFVRGKGFAYCAPGPRYRWTRSYTVGETQRLLEANLPLLIGSGNAPGRLMDMATEGRSAGGRVQALRIVTDSGQFEIRRDAIRWLFGEGKAGPDGLPSTLFCLRTERDHDGSLARLVFEGAGWGHGLGLCQWGADGRARAGASAPEILEYYYPGTRVIDLAAYDGRCEWE